MISAFLPYIVSAVVALGGIAWGIFKHLQANTKIAQASQQVSQAQTAVAQAKTTVAEVNDAASQANATAAQAGAESLKEKVNVTNDVAAMPAGAAADELRDSWSK